MWGRFSRPVAVASLVFLSATWCSSVSAAIKPVGQVILANGPFIAIQSDKSSRSLTRGSEFYQGDRLWTGPSTKAQVRFSDGAIMTLRPDTEFSVDEYEFDAANAANNKSLFTLVKGGFRTLTGLITKLRPDSYKVKTAYAIVGVRGTTYETVIDSGLYAAAWQGTIYVENEKKLLELGFGQEFNYARVTSPNSAPAGLLEVPPQLQETIDPGLREAVVDPTLTRLTTGFLQDGVDARLTAAELASLDRTGFATSGGSTISAVASDGSGGNPIFLSANAVLRQGSAPSVGVATDTRIVGFPVSFGGWNASLGSPATIQPDAANPGLTVAVTDPVFWVTMLAPTNLPAGTVVYNFAGSQIQSTAQGASGAVLVNPVLTFRADLDFGKGALTNGQMTVLDGSLNWSTQFTGQVTGANFSATLGAGSAVNTNPAVGALAGGVTGPNAEGIGGVFNFQDQINPTTTFIKGAFSANPF